MQTPPSAAANGARPIVITGLAACTPLGDTLTTTWQSLLDGRPTADYVRGPLDLSPPQVNGLARRVALQATEAAGWSLDQLHDAALVVGTSKGPIEAWIDSSSSSILNANSFGLAAVASDLGMANGPRLTLSPACASGLHALIRATMLIRDGRVDRALVVAVESSLHPLFIGSFRRLGVLPPPGIGWRPFDLDRAGFLMSEAAAAVCLERGDQRGIRIERFALGGDAVHLTHGDPTGDTLRRLLNSVLDSKSVALIPAPATGTKTNDATELAAIQSAVVGPPPTLYSHKGALGHSLGAAGLISIVINCLCHANGLIPPNIRTQRPLPMDGI